MDTGDEGSSPNGMLSELGLGLSSDLDLKRRIGREKGEERGMLR